MELDHPLATQQHLPSTAHRARAVNFRRKKIQRIPLGSGCDQGGLLKRTLETIFLCQNHLRSVDRKC